MPMNPNFLCCIGAELKNSTQQTTRMSQVYLYRSFEDETLSDMLSAGFFNAAMGIIRQDDLLLLYSPNETTAKYTYARVSSVSSSGVVIEQIGIDATGISVDTTGYSNLSGNNLQEILNNLDTTLTTINNAFVRKDGSSVMTGPLKFRAGSFVGAIAGGLGDGISIYKLKSDDSIDSEVASLTKENGFTPGTTNAQDIGSSSLKWKDLYVARVIASVLNNGANISVPTVGGTMALVEDINNKITNCITEIPQDIKLELSSGTLTHAVGSKFYTPDGTAHTVSTSSSVPIASSDGQHFVYCAGSSGVLQAISATSLVSRAASGSSLPADGTDYSVFLNTSDSKIYRYTGGAWSEWVVSFPLGIVTVSGGVITSIDQVFNGFGYIGSTVFALPGVKGLAPNGRNADGTLKNTEFTVSSVLTTTDSSSVTSGLEYYLGSTSINRAPFGTYFYDAESNNIFDNSGIRQNIILIAPSAYRISGTVASFNPKQVFHALDYNDTEFIANCAMPSARYIDLTLPADGNSVTAPTDGILYLSKNSDATGQRIRFWNRTTSASISTWSSGVQNLEIVMSVSKGDSITVVYNADGTTNAFKFIYANGAK